MRRIIRRREVVEDELRYPGEAPEAGTVAVRTAAEWWRPPERQVPQRCC